MATASVGEARSAEAGGPLLACVAEQGSASHPYFASESLLAGACAGRNLADAVHMLCSLHGRHPGVADLAGAHTLDPEARAWLAAAADAFHDERRYLARLAAAVGPVPGTPGARDSEATVRAQQVAIATLARSEREGCALGAALALIADWSAIRKLLDAAARRCGLEPAPSRLAPPLATAEAAAGPGGRRALLFGAQQLLAQHRGLWDLLEARCLAREPQRA